MHHHQHHNHHSQSQSQQPQAQPQTMTTTNPAVSVSSSTDKSKSVPPPKVRGLEDLFDEDCRLEQDSNASSHKGGGDASSCYSGANKSLWGTSHSNSSTVSHGFNNNNNIDSGHRRPAVHHLPRNHHDDDNDEISADYGSDGSVDANDNHDGSYDDEEYEEYNDHHDEEEEDSEYDDYNNNDDDDDDKLGRGVSHLLSTHSSSSPVSCFDLDLVLTLEGHNHRMVDVSNLVPEHERSASILRQRLEDLQQAQKSLLASRSSGLSTVLESPYSLESSTDENNYCSEEDDDLGNTDHDGEDHHHHHSSFGYPLDELDEIITLPDSVVERYFRARPTVHSSNLSRMKQDSNGNHYSRNSEAYSDQHQHHKQQQQQQQNWSSSSRPGAHSVSNASKNGMAMSSREEMKMRQLEAVAVAPSSTVAAAAAATQPGAQAVRNSTNRSNSREDLKMRQMEAIRPSSSSQQPPQRQGLNPDTGSGDVGRTNLPSESLLLHREQDVLSKQHPLGPPATRPGAQSVSGGSSANQFRGEMKMGQMEALRDPRRTAGATASSGGGGDGARNGDSGKSNDNTVKPGAQAVSGRPTREDFKQRELQALREQRGNDTTSTGTNSNGVSKPGAQSVNGRPTREDFKQRELQAFKEEQAKKTTTTTTSASIMSRQQREEIKLREIAAFHQQRNKRPEEPPSSVRRQSSFEEVEPRLNSYSNASNFHRSFEEIDIPTALTSDSHVGIRGNIARDSSFEDNQQQSRHPLRRSRSPTSSLPTRRRSSDEDQFGRRPSFEQQQPRHSSLDMQPQPHYDPKQRPHINHADSIRSYYSSSSNESQRKPETRRQESLRQMQQQNSRFVERENSPWDGRLPVRGPSESSFRRGSGSYQVPPRPNNGSSSNSRYSGLEGSSFRSQGSYEQPPYGRGGVMGGGLGQYVDYGYTEQQDYHENPPPTHNQLYQSSLPPPQQRYQPPPPPPPAIEGLQIEIEPGFFAELRGAEETMTAIAAGRVASVECLCCCLALQCIADAEYVLCPDCKVVSPIFNGIPGRGGVGLGLRSAIANSSRGDGASASSQRAQPDHYYQSQNPQNYPDYGGGGRHY